jgi:hypothetical protein
MRRNTEQNVIIVYILCQATSTMVPTLRIVSSLLCFLVALPVSTSFALTINNNNGRTNNNNNNNLLLTMTSRKTKTAHTSTNSICPLLDAPQNPAATFEAAMG